MYGHIITVITDHAAVKVVLGIPNLTGQHSRWWSKVYGSGIRHIEILHTPGKKNQPADALSRQPALPAPVDDGTSEDVQIAHISSNDTASISTLLKEDSNNVTSSSDIVSMDNNLGTPLLIP